MIDEVIEARLTAWQDGYGGVELKYQSGRCVAIALSKPHGTLPASAARRARLGEYASVGILPDRIYAKLMAGPATVTELCALAKEDEGRKNVYNAIGYLKRHGCIQLIARNVYQVVGAQKRRSGHA